MNHFWDVDPSPDCPQQGLIRDITLGWDCPHPPPPPGAAFETSLIIREMIFCVIFFFFFFLAALAAPLSFPSTGEYSISRPIPGILWAWAAQSS